MVDHKHILAEDWSTVAPVNDANRESIESAVTNMPRPMR